MVPAAILEDLDFIKSEIWSFSISGTSVIVFELNFVWIYATSTELMAVKLKF